MGLDGNRRKELENGTLQGGEASPAEAPPAEAVECEVIAPPRRRGRPSKRTPEIEAAIYECLRLGMTCAQTCDSCGVSQSQFRNWRRNFRDFQDLVRRAEAEAVKLNLAVIQAAAASGKSWQAAAWFLERKHPEQWGRTETLTIDAKRKAVEETLIKNITPGRTPEQLRELRQILGLHPSTDAETIEAAAEHAKGEEKRRRACEIFGTPFEAKPFEGIQGEKRGGLSTETLKKVEKMLGIFPDAPPTREERIKALIELQAKAREVAGKPPLSKAEAFEAAACELDKSGA